MHCSLSCLQPRRSVFTARYGLNDYVLVHSVRKCALVSWLRRLVAGLPPRSLRFDLRSVHVRFVLDRVTLGQVFLLILLFPLSVSFHLYCTHNLIYTLLIAKGRCLQQCSLSESGSIGQKSSL